MTSNRVSSSSGSARVLAHHARRNFSLVASVVVLALAVAVAARAQTSTVPTGRVDDAFSQHGIKSDGRSASLSCPACPLYTDGVDCVSVAAISGPGFSQIRTVKNSDFCNAQTWTQRRFLTVDFGSSVTFDLDRDPSDADATIERVPARFIANDVWAQKPSTTPVSILVLKVNNDGTTTQDTAWQFTYHNQAPITVNADGSRSFSLSPLQALADLCEVVHVVKGGRVSTSCVLRGTFDLPFSVTVTR